MPPSFLLLAAADLALLGLTAILGLLVSGTDGFTRHFLLGVLSGMFTCFVHIILFMYFVVQDKIMKQAHLHNGLDASLANETEAIKSRALRACVGGFASILVTVAMGAAIGVFVPPEAHLVAAFAAIGINGSLFIYQYTLLIRYRDIFARAFPDG
ncbi:MAG: hypothetical protein AABZ08_09520 [Planctomycetota bacterium]